MDRLLPAARILLVSVGVSEAVRLSGWRAALCLSVESAAPPKALAALVRAVEREPELVPGVRRVRVLEHGSGSVGGAIPLANGLDLESSSRRSAGVRKNSACPRLTFRHAEFFLTPASGRLLWRKASANKTGAMALPWGFGAQGTCGRSADGSWDGWVRYEVEGTAYGLPWRVRFWKAWEGDAHFLWRSDEGTGCPEQWGELALRPHGAGTRMELRARTRSALPVLGGAATLLVNPLFLAPVFSGWLRNLVRAADAEGHQPGASPGSL